MRIKDGKKTDVDVFSRHIGKEREFKAFNRSIGEPEPEKEHRIFGRSKSKKNKKEILKSKESFPERQEDRYADIRSHPAESKKDIYVSKEDIYVSIPEAPETEMTQTEPLTNQTTEPQKNMHSGTEKPKTPEMPEQVSFGMPKAAAKESVPAPEGEYGVWEAGKAAGRYSRKARNMYRSVSSGENGSQNSTGSNGMDAEKATKKVRDVAVAAAGFFAKALIGIVGLPLFLILVLFLFIGSILLVLLMGRSAEGTGRANVSPACEQYRTVVEEYAAEYAIGDFTEILMCIMMQESAGIGTDVMQCSESPFNTEYPQVPNGITDAVYSIDVGVQTFQYCLTNAGCTEPEDMPGIKLALQDYNFGNGYAAWALENYGEYSLENARIFSALWQDRLGVSAYGDTEYVPHVLQYYIVQGGFEPDGISNTEALEKLEMLQKSWPENMDERRGAVIAKGASLIGYTKYAHNGEGSRTGSDMPSYEDCSSFVAWAFQKAGFTDVPYWSTTGTFVTATNFEEITTDSLVPGDVGLLNEIASGSANHIGIYVGNDENGIPMWLHCTSHASPGFTSVTDGPRISYYSFQRFYRYTGFQDREE